jgi:ketosteroid isomerase-like protein
MVGPTNVYGFQSILQLYRDHYPNRAAQGTLSFSDLEVRRLDDQFSTVTGHFHLTRSADGGGNVNGYFLLVAEKTPKSWKIVRDASFALRR